MDSTDSLRAFLNGLIDYAGLFPPAQLSLDNAVEEFAGHRQSDHAWMLGRFICPAARLDDLAGKISGDTEAVGPFRLSLLGRGGATEGELATNLAADSRDLLAFRSALGKQANVEVVEMKLPASATAVEAAGKWASEHGLRLFAELDHARDIEAQQNAIDAMTRRGDVGYKLRCGGVEASAFPSTRAVAEAISACRDARVPMKFTAGLHHPVRHYNDSVKTKMHGFFNVFAGCIFADVNGASIEQLDDVLSEEDASAFVFDEAMLRWREQQVTPEQIAEARRNFAISYGSCSFDEPCDDLTAMHLI